MTRTWGTVLVAAVVLVPEAARAQGEPYARVSFSSTQAYEDNLFATPVSREPQSDLMFRFGPAVEAGFLSSPLRLVARYAFDAERFLDHVALNKTFARQDAALELHHAATRRLALDAAASYVDTHTPRELNLDTGLAVGRARGKRLSVRPAATYEWTPRTRLGLDYELTREALAGGLLAVVHEAGLGVERRSGERAARRIDYRVRHFRFGDRRSEASHVVTVGWSREITRLTGLELALGPRVSDGRLGPELTALLRRRFQNGELSASYAKTQATAIGEAGAFEVQRVGAAILYRRGRRLTLTASPAYIESAREGVRLAVYALDVEAVGRTRRGLTVIASSRVGLQQGTSAGGREEIPYRGVLLRLVATFPRTSRIEPGR